MDGIKNMEKFLRGKNVFGIINQVSKTITGIKNGKDFKIYYHPTKRNPLHREEPLVVVEYKGEISYPANNRDLGEIFK